MSKIISPLLFRFKNIPQYLNELHIKLNNNKNYLTYFKFFQILLNFIYLFKNKIEKYSLFSNKFLYLCCNYNDFYNINISLVFNDLKKKQLIKLYISIIKISNYINYFIKYNLYNNNYFTFIQLKVVRNYNENIYNILSSIKYYIKNRKNFKLRVIKFINSLFKLDYKDPESTIQGVKCIYSGCLYKHSKKKSFKYSKGSTSASYLFSQTLYAQKILKTSKGAIGIKLWLNI